MLRLGAIPSALKTIRHSAARAILCVLPVLWAGSYFANVESSSVTLERPHRGPGNSYQEATTNPPQPSIKFREISSQAGLTTMPSSSAERHYIVETMGGGGVGLFD